ncbi:hypothetical protein [Mangrovihabitans endophyticus]|uniref:Cell division protein FtsB n=1 Tax=Mangrovihabitans endophyticus TaxID=1751298 RepID=A0A8J3BUL7_9ACTN|nr:hypothetical protein [Mangrovihabitans endophyticus]GGK70519.1 hypothetical protein GCM10012284_00480 [Mangrovihabitans endophyticus]
MSERTYVPRSGGRIAEQRSAGQNRRAGGRGEADIPVPGTRRTGARAGGRARAGDPVQAPVEGTAALQLSVQPTRAADAPEPSLRVAPPAPVSAPRAPFMVLVIGLVVAGVLGILLVNTKTNENSFKISNLEDQQAKLDTQQQELENQIATYESAGNLDAAARRLGLVKAGAPAYIRLPDGKIIGVPRPGEGAPAVTAQNG